MPRDLSIVMYHYVRDTERTPYPDIKARSVAQFRHQLDHIGRNYQVVTVRQIVEALRGGAPLPANAAWLTFDDGYVEHYTTVFPLLRERGWEGSFFPPVNAIRDRQLLDVNRIHFILAAQPETQRIIDEIRSFVDDRRDTLRPFDSYWAEFARPTRLDTAEVIFIKRMLQHALPDAMRNGLAADLFERMVSADATGFASELYVTPSQLREMIDGGMYVGSHGVSHLWLDKLDGPAQVAEIEGSLAFLRSIGAPVDDWVMCYPWGAFNETLLPLLSERGCAAALTVRVAVANLDSDHPLKLPRLDTNDLPVG